MARYTGPRLKVMRALGIDLPGLSRKSIEKRPYPPGQHVNSRSMRKSDFGLKLQEKQKLRFNYGISERQLRRLMLDARCANAPTGEKLLELLERRLDNVVFRAGFAPTIAAARQLVNHRHVLLNGHTATIASLRTRVGDQVSLHSRAANRPLILETWHHPALTRPDWLAIDNEKRLVTITHLPESDSVPFPIDIQKVIEYYAQRL